MAKIVLKNIRKEYPNFSKKRGEKNQNVVAVENFDMEINDGEFVVFVGPSGCGKSTTLRMIAGLENITAGELYIGDLLVNDIPAKDRNISMVFQNYALYPHMTVYQNICFPLNYARFKHPVKAREIEIKNAEKEIAFGKKILSKMEQKHADELHGYSKEEVEKKIKINEEVLANSKKQLEIAQTTLEEMKPTKEECLQAKKVEKEDPEHYKEDHAWIKCRKYYEATRTRYSKKDKEEIVNRVASLVDVSNYLQRKPKALSGGQRQRVALARALVRTPKAFLLDEPLSNLDAKLRTQMRSEIVALHNKIKTTFIYVTHDQVEAMTMGDRIVVMSMGKVQQISTPTDLFDNPKNKFVAGFIGTPQMNFFAVDLKVEKNKIIINFDEQNKLSFALDEVGTIDKEYVDGFIHKVTLGARSENILLSKKGIPGVVKGIEILGNETRLFVESINEQKNIVIRTYDRPNIKMGDEIHYTIDPKKIHLFDLSPDEKAILKRGE